LHNFNGVKDLVFNCMVYAADSLSSQLTSVLHAALQSFCELTHSLDKQLQLQRSHHSIQSTTRQWLDHDG